jgi:hypothetical protein
MSPHRRRGRSPYGAAACSAQAHDRFEQALRRVPDDSVGGEGIRRAGGPDERSATDAIADRIVSSRPVTAAKGDVFVPAHNIGRRGVRTARRSFAAEAATRGSDAALLQ